MGRAVVPLGSAGQTRPGPRSLPYGTRACLQVPGPPGGPQALATSPSAGPLDAKLQLPQPGGVTPTPRWAAAALGEGTPCAQPPTRGGGPQSGSRRSSPRVWRLRRVPDSHPGARRSGVTLDVRSRHSPAVPRGDGKWKKAEHQLLDLPHPRRTALNRLSMSCLEQSPALAASQSSGETEARLVTCHLALACSPSLLLPRPPRRLLGSQFPVKH